MAIVNVCDRNRAPPRVARGRRQPAPHEQPVAAAHRAAVVQGVRGRSPPCQLPCGGEFRVDGDAGGLGPAGVGVFDHDLAGATDEEPQVRTDLRVREWGDRGGDIVLDHRGETPALDETDACPHRKGAWLSPSPSKVRDSAWVEASLPIRVGGLAPRAKTRGVAARTATPQSFGGKGETNPPRALCQQNEFRFYVIE